LYFLEFGHAAEGSVEVEEAAVVAAAEMGEAAGFVDYEVAAVGADVGEKAWDAFVVDQDEGFVEIVFEEGERAGVAGLFDGACVANELPGGGETFFFYFFEELRVGIEGCIRGFGFGDIGIY
jgi:hypothetical protein